ncbi:MAG: ATPase, T2SS/T4P/T4SS family [Tepidisphaeraceae bacterium]
MKPPYLQITTPAGVTQCPVGNDPISIGRQIGNTLVLEDSEASRFHCVVERSAGGYRVRDLGSRNGTRVNEDVVKTALLENGDVIRIGKTEIRLVSGANQPAGAAAKQAAGDDDHGSLRLLSPDEVPAMRSSPGAATLGAADPHETVAPVHVPSEESPPGESLFKLADALPDKTINQHDIALINARGQLAHPSGAAGRRRDAESSGEAITLLRLLLLVCFRTRASDIHIEPKNDLYLVRVRIDGTMVDAAKLKRENGVRLTSVIKILSDIDISQRNIVQEGHFTTKVPDRRVDYRVSFTPAMYGQKCVIRVLDSANAPRYLWDLQLPEWMFKDIDRVIRGDSGMVLVSGPTGSGKTASLYATLRSIDSGERNVVTIEDPVEIQIEGITQMPVNDEQGNTFANLLRSVLRQDPDVILVGEIRDNETARTAMQAAMTGHLVLSTVHARDTIGAIFRLQDLGVEPFQLSSGLQLVLAQRLVRHVCQKCRVAMNPSPEQSAKLEPVAGKVETIYRSAGCAQCLGTGYSGRQAVFELLTVTDGVREVMQGNRFTPMDVHKSLDGTKFSKLMQNGYKLVADGVTTIDEIERVVGL